MPTLRPRRPSQNLNLLGELRHPKLNGELWLALAPGVHAGILGAPKLFAFGNYNTC